MYETRAGFGPRELHNRILVLSSVMKKLLLLLSLCLTPWLHAQNGDRPGEVQSGLPADMVVPPAPALTPEEAL